MAANLNKYFKRTSALLILLQLIALLSQKKIGILCKTTSMLKGHGDDIYSQNISVRYNFSSNVWHYPYIEQLKKHLTGEFDCLVSYPEPEADSLRNILQKTHQLNQNQVIVTNGATEAFYMIANAWHSARSTIAVPSFSEYEDAAKHAGHTCQFVTARSFEGISALPADLVWLCNPNNPDGFVFPIDLLLKLLADFPERIYIIDEVYIDFSSKAESLIQYLHTFDNLIIVKSLTKLYSIPALRLGYLLCSEKLYPRLIAQKQPWSVNSLAIEAGTYVLNSASLSYEIEEYKKGIKQFGQMLSEIEGLEVCESDANFFLCRLEDGQAGTLKEYLLDKFGILIRDASNFRALNDKYFRVSCLSDEINRFFCKTVSEWITAVVVKS